MSDVCWQDSAAEKRATLRQFFDTIAPRYDRINDLLSLNLAEAWRNRARDLVLEGSPRAILDLGTGTGKFLQVFLEAQSWDRAVALDFSSAMLNRARQELGNRAGWVSGDFHDLPFADQAFDLVISAYTLRSVQEMAGFFREIRRLLRPGGAAALLCLTRPRGRVWRVLAYPYLKWVLPRVGGWISGNRKAYEFLSSSVLTFQEPEVTASLLREQGFREARIHSFSLGLATLIVAYR